MFKTHLTLSVSQLESQIKLWQWTAVSLISILAVFA
jgi:hypothetical protein